MKPDITFLKKERVHPVDPVKDRSCNGTDILGNRRGVGVAGTPLPVQDMRGNAAEG
jgi:hypothetical protein